MASPETYAGGGSPTASLGPAIAPVLVGGEWRASAAREVFVKQSPVDGTEMGTYPVSPWSEVAEMVEHGWTAYDALSEVGPDTLARFLEGFADVIDDAASQLVAAAASETALPSKPRLRDAELPRTTLQLRKAALAARDRTWTLPTISLDSQIASLLVPMAGAVVIFGPNNFPFAFNGIGGGDFAAAIATGHPVIAKANTGHPETSRILATLAQEVAAENRLPPATVQMLYRTDHAAGARLVGHEQVAATAYTGSRRSGLALKAAADAAGRPIYLEMSSVNPVVLLTGAVRSRREEIAQALAASALQGMGQFCTSPGLILIPVGSDGDDLVHRLGEHLTANRPAPLLGIEVRVGLEEVKARWIRAGAKLVAQSGDVSGACVFPTSLLTADQDVFLRSPSDLQTEAFGNMVLTVRFKGVDGLLAIVDALEGSLTGTIYSAPDGTDNSVYDSVAPRLRRRVGRFIDDKVPTGVSVVAGMNHGGPYPATGHPGFTSVGIPASLRRFGAILCFDGLRPDRLPQELQPHNPLGIQRFVNGEWTRDPVDWPRVTR